MANARFAISVHMMLLMAIEENQWLSSSYMAQSIDVNPGIVRRELIGLKEKGLVESKEGKGGGSRLARPADKITLGHIYEVVKDEYLLGLNKNNPLVACPIGKNINKNLSNLYEEADGLINQRFHQITLKKFLNQFI
ncbi:Rrf2 family transcriptional regulator [Xanthovirga aplysinae]|uniref:Rrf2 family transcriptional regulator n=1 Tax=Xanthovirga aplysinae TaxID=2529853 RepID=UPI0012BD0535|nr:Rrf2 family transcriptional regulator [Xanthovirga aplysinae]MTI29604.1 Rrf2 family transcriptional regulator [Xanthovirga aplysinae]